MFPIKVIFNEEIKRVQVHSDMNSFSYANLLETAASLFPTLRNFTRFKVYWRDDENDLVYCSCDVEVAEALRVMVEGGSSVKAAKFIIKVEDRVQSVPNAESKSANLSLHVGVQCDECGECPIQGFRFKCTVRNDYDLCEACESARIQPYPNIKKYLTQTDF